MLWHSAKMGQNREALLKGKAQYSYLLVLTRLDQLLFNIENIIYFSYKTSNLKGEVNCT